MLPRPSLADRRRIGAYYTPRTIADILCSWAIKSATDHVLEPSFGGCSFLRSSKERLQALGCPDPNSQLFGCDVDPHAFEQLHTHLGLTQIREHFILEDFLAIDPTAFGERQFDVVIGNPPYVRHHDITTRQRVLAARILRETAPNLSLQANLWAFFVLHSCRFLKQDGRVAWLLPASFGYTHYAAPLRRYLSRHFRHVNAFSLTQRLFQNEGAAEATIIVLADGWRGSALRLTRIEGSVVANTSDLHLAISTLREQQPPLSQELHPRKVLRRLYASSRPLSALCSLSIGIVTGDAEFFLFDASKAKLHGIQSTDLRSVVSRTQHLSGLRVSRAELIQKFDDGARTKILQPRAPVSRPVARYLRRKTQAEILSNLTFGKRPFWFRPQIRQRPDAFFICMSHHGPRIVLNAANAPCTNSLYEVTFSNKVSALRRSLIAISMMSTFSQLSAELSGRRYGAGMLKHEPSDAGNIHVLLPRASRAQVMQAFDAIDLHLRTGDQDSAVRAADDFMIQRKLITADHNILLQNELRRLRKLRLSK